MKNKILKIAVSVVSCIMGLCFLIQSIRIYTAGNGYSRELVSSYILQILAVIVCWVVLVIALQILLRKEKIVDKVKTSNYHLYKLFASKIDEKAIKDNNDINSYKKKILIINIISVIIFVLMSVMASLYIFNFNNFIYADGVDITAQIGQMALHTLPWLVISFVVGVCGSYVSDYYYGKMVSILKSLLKENKKSSNDLDLNKQKQIIIYALQGFIIILSIVFIIVGVSDGGFESATQKAINICTECIGLG